MAETMTVDQGEIAKAWQQAEAEGSKGRVLPTTGAALTAPDSELERNRALVNAKPTEIPDGQRRKFFTPPPEQAGGEQQAPEAAAPEVEGDTSIKSPVDLYVPPHERSRQNSQQSVVADGNLKEQAPAPALEAVDEEGLILERRLLGGLKDDDPLGDALDTKVKIGDREIPLSRIRDWKQAADERDKWRADLTQKQQAQADAFRAVISDWTRGALANPIGTLRQLGASDDQINEAFARAGYAPSNAPASQATAALSVPEDADPATKALAQHAQRLDRTVAQQTGVIRGLYDEIQREKAARDRVESEKARAAVMSGVKSDLVSAASKMPSMRGQDGKLTPTARLLVDSTVERLQMETGSAVPEHATARERAFTMFGERAREVGITPKAEQARRALEGRKSIVPSRTGGTPARVSQAASSPEKPPDFSRVDFTDDNARREAGRRYMAWLDTQLPTG